MLKFVLNLFFPPVCGICGKYDDNWICTNCKNKMISSKKTSIFKVYKKKYEEFGFIFLYKNIRDLILEYKFNNKAYLSNMFANLILDDENIVNELKKYDIIIPVPMNKKKKSKRGYNQTELIAKQISEKLNLEYNNISLVKIKNNNTQSKLKGKERFENVKGIFNVKNSHLVKDKNIILFDDIFTTGATVNECSKMLKLNKVKKIFVLTIAKD